ncbi:uncharacterized protein LOC141795165 [Halichoeres trimaculatus]|uniref:uncharacterized protein LOC141795165 n=1 Tax=Halichoeres trimaculatus TaxID=147232 RepID=UPI003D9E9158
MHRTINRVIINRNAHRQGMEVERLRREVRDLTEMLELERSRRCLVENQKLQLSQELEQTKENLARQKALKEMFINRGKETKRELETLQKYSSQETLSRHRIALKVRDTTRQKKKKHLHADYEELQVAHLVNTEKFDTELKEASNKISALQEELQRVTASNQELNIRYDTDIRSAKLQVENLQQELQQQSQAQADRATKDQQVILALRTEQDLLRQKMSEEVAALQQNAFQKEMMYWNELQELKTQRSAQEASKEYGEDHKTVKENLRAELQWEQDRSKLLREELEQMKVYNQELQQRYDTDLQTLNHQAESQKQELQTQIQSLNNKIAEEQLEIWSTKAELSEVKEKMAEEINALKQTFMERESAYRRELEEQRRQCALLLSRNTQLPNEPEEEQAMESITTMMEETAGPSGSQVPALTLVPEGTPGSEDPAETAGAAGPPETPSPSVWKRTRHFLGLKKPQGWKKK